MGAKSGIKLILYWGCLSEFGSIELIQVSLSICSRADLCSSVDSLYVSLSIFSFFFMSLLALFFVSLLSSIRPLNSL